MLSLILGFITGLAGPISSIVSRISDLKIAQLKASTDIKRVEIQAQLEEAHDRKAVLIAEAGSRIVGTLNGFARFALFGLPAGIVIWKLLVWDKVVGSFYGCTAPGLPSKVFYATCKTFRTDSIDPNL